jgi:hypothetical protein
MAEIFTNDATDALAGDINSSATTIGVVSGTQFPATGNFRIRIDNEIMTVTAVSGLNWTVTRASESLMGQQVASSHSNGTIIYGVLTAGALIARYG